MPKRSNTNEFISRGRIVHNNKYTYKCTIYKNSRTKVLIDCPIHGQFNQEANAHLQGSGCPECGYDTFSSKTRMTQDKFVKSASTIHNNKYDYSRVNYVTAHVKIEIICPSHGLFLQTPAKHSLQGTGCPKCGSEIAATKNAKTNTCFIDEANLIHKNKYNYTNTVYTNTHNKVEIMCPIHGSFFQSPTNHIHSYNQNGCPKCAKKSFSEKAIKWLDYVALTNKITIQHAINSSEFKIPGTKFKADGYCTETNTIYEFYGDVFHGNPYKFNTIDCCHPYNKSLTANQLFDTTQRREQQLLTLGYNIVTIWERDWDVFSAELLYKNQHLTKET